MQGLCIVSLGSSITALPIRTRLRPVRSFYARRACLGFASRQPRIAPRAPGFIFALKCFGKAKSILTFGAAAPGRKGAKTGIFRRFFGIKFSVLYQFALEMLVKAVLEKARGVGWGEYTMRSK